MLLKNGNSLELMKELKDDSVDLIVTSPPYNMNLRIRKGKYCSRQIVKELTTKYQGYDDNLPMDDYFNLLDQTIKEGLRVSSMIFFNIQVLTGNKPAVWRLIGKYHKNLKEVIIWDKINAQPAIGKNILNSRFEFILIFSKNGISRSFPNANFNRGTLDNVWQIKRGKKKHKNHGATFPEELIEKIILNFSNENDVILDPFMGTGTTGVISKKNNRNFIGFELVKDYFEFAKKEIGSF